MGYKVESTQITPDNLGELYLLIRALQGLADSEAPAMWSAETCHSPVEIGPGRKGYVDWVNQYIEGNHKITITIEQVAPDEFWLKRAGKL